MLDALARALEHARRRRDGQQRPLVDEQQLLLDAHGERRALAERCSMRERLCGGGCSAELDGDREAAVGAIDLHLDLSPGRLRAMIERSRSGVVTGMPSTATMMSPPSRQLSPPTITVRVPARSPALSAALSGTTESTTSPRRACSGSRKSRAMSSVSGVVSIPKNACSTLPTRMICAVTLRTVSTGIANPTPTLLSEEPPVAICVFTPIT